jgi:poly(A) polymerase
MHSILKKFLAWLDGSGPLPLKRETAALAPVEGEELRVFLDKLLLHPRRGEGVRMLVECGLSRAVMPELDALVGVEQPEAFHPEGDCFVHTVLSMEHLDEPTFELALATLLHDIGKPRTFTDTDRIRFHGHEGVSARMARRICRRMGLDGETTGYVAELVALHMQIKDVERMSEKTLTKFVRREYFADLIALARADCLASHGDLSAVEYAERKAKEIGPEPPPPPSPLITGDDLIAEGHTPGPLFKTILGRVAELREQGKIATRDDALRFARKEYPSGQ